MSEIESEASVSENSTNSDDNEDETENCLEHTRRKRSAGYAWYGGNPNSNPVFGPRMQLYCKTDWMIGLYSKNIVLGSRDDNDKFTFFELSSTDIPGDIRIQCIENKLYLAMKKSGRLYGEADPSKDNTIFIETLAGSYNNYLSRKWAHLGYYVGIKRSGKIKKGKKTGYGQKAIQFLPRRSNIQ